tara:strand:- start:24 stop:1022 length:999 start_codon:yes stop_codon:yes gene_type:complete
MAGYNTIKGLRVKYLSEDPSNPEDGQVWYNSGTGNLRVQGISQAAAWASAAGPTRNNNAMSSGGTPTAAILSGENGANPPNSAEAEEWDGSGWTNLTNIPASYGYNVGTGLVNDFSSMGGGYGPTPKVANVYDWNGSGWTSGTAMPTAVIEMGVCGPGQQALVAGGYTSTNIATSYERSGGSWTSNPSMNVARYVPQLIGSNKDSALAAGGVTYPSGPPSARDSVEGWNGTAWTTKTVMPSVRAYAGSAGSSVTDAFVFGGDTTGSPATTGTSIKWDGSSWSADATMAVARGTLGGFGSSPAAFCSAGNNASPGNSELYNGASVVTKNISTS